jgi:hypothetical protein
MLHGVLRHTCLAILGFSILSAGQAFAAREDSLPTRFSVVVVDEAGTALPGVSVVVSVFQEGGALDRGMSKRSYFRRISEPASPLQVRTESLGIVTLRADKEGYYTDLEKLDLELSEDGRRYEPWNGTIRIVLRHKASPRALYVHRADWTDVPGFDAPFGFDLEKADWVAPHGIGVQPDFLIQVRRTFGNGEVYRGEMDIDFAQQADGVIPISDDEYSASELLLGREAPLDGYQSSYKRIVGVADTEQGLRVIDQPTREEIQHCAGVWFRVRSELDEITGLVKRARYGKIDGYIDFAARARDEPAHIAFIYYLSPDESRSLEWNGESLVESPDLQGITKF